MNRQLWPFCIFILNRADDSQVSTLLYIEHYLCRSAVVKSSGEARPPCPPWARTTPPAGEERGGRVTLHQLFLMLRFILYSFALRLYNYIVGGGGRQSNKEGHWQSWRLGGGFRQTAQRSCRLANLCRVPQEGVQSREHILLVRR